MTVPQADNTLAAIRTKVRRLTASASESVLATSTIDSYVNCYYNNDFPYSIKIDQMRSVYTFFTIPYVDRYPIDVNYNMGFREPVYVEGIRGCLYKDRQPFFALWPRFPTKFQQGTTILTGTITGIAQPTNPTQITSANHNLSTGAVVQITGVGGMTQLNGNSYTITVINANSFSLNGVDNTAFGAYTTGGTWTATNQTFSFTIPGPFLSKEVVIGGLDNLGNAINLTDDGNGNIIYMTTNPVTSVPPQNTNPAVPGMYNRNLGNPGLINPTIIGTVNYISGLINFTLPASVSLGEGNLFTVWVSQYTTGRPYNILFWNNEFTIRPIPKLIHKIEVETFLSPVQFMQSTDSPILNQWWQLIAVGASRKILEDRQDMEGLANLDIIFKQQEALVLERQAVEEIYQPNLTLFNTAQPYNVGPWGNVGSF